LQRHITIHHFSTLKQVSCFKSSRCDHVIIADCRKLERMALGCSASTCCKSLYI